MDRWGFALDRGGRVVSAASAAELPPLVRDWGYELGPSAFDDLVRQRLGPEEIFAAEVVPAVTMTFGGNSRKAPRVALVLGHVIDMADHYSQISNYMRLNGMLPPTALQRRM